MKLSPWRIAAIVGLAALFGLRIYFSQQQKKEREQQQQMMYELSRQQMKAQQEMDQKRMQDFYKEQASELDELQSNLDSIGKKMKEDQAKFEEKMKALEAEKQ